MGNRSSAANRALTRHGHGRTDARAAHLSAHPPVSAEFIVAYAGSSVAQAALVAGATAGTAAPLWIRALRHPAFALAPLLSLVGVVGLLRVWPGQAHVLATVALVLVPLLALLTALRTGPRALLLTVAMIVAVLHDDHSLAGQLSALGLIGASCMLLGALLVELTPPRWLSAGIAAMAAADLVLVASGALGPAADVLNAAGVGKHLPQLQRVELGPLEMGYGDVFLPALVGALMAAHARPRIWAAALTLGFALAAGLVFLAFDRLPATVPVALALLVVEGVRALASGRCRARSSSREDTDRSACASAASSSPAASASAA
jgi:hypothetical protein